MNVAFGMKAHSGWAAVVVLGEQNDLVVVDRRRLELVEDEWAKQPYHAAEGLKPELARDLVKRGIDAARKNAGREMKAALKRELERKNRVKGCGVLVGSPMPDWSVDEILAVHFRMHKAEGVLFRDVLLQAAKECGLKAVEVPEKDLYIRAERVLKTPANELATQITALGKSVGPPWGKDQKEAALAAMITLRSR
ncbi:MAG TPA: hypothetical protein VGQ41_16470 [Pyrinomonadaceae bacterium]|jgi:hypothetical protein|nr:hypothetical protein [Pyrinomonadaceae bacterium]